jgi:hypothetical protein
VFSPSVLSPFGLPLPPSSLLLTVSEARSYFASAVSHVALAEEVSNKYRIFIGKPEGKKPFGRHGHI